MSHEILMIIVMFESNDNAIAGIKIRLSFHSVVLKQF